MGWCQVREAGVFSLSMLSESQFGKDNMCLITNPALFGQPSLTHILTALSSITNPSITS